MVPKETERGGVSAGHAFLCEKRLSKTVMTCLVIQHAFVDVCRLKRDRFLLLLPVSSCVFAFVVVVVIVLYSKKAPCKHHPSPLTLSSSLHCLELHLFLKFSTGEVQSPPFPPSKSGSGLDADPHHYGKQRGNGEPFRDHSPDQHHKLFANASPHR